MPHTDTRRDITRSQATYDIYFEIDCDCQELLDAIGLDYKEVEDDDTQNEVALSLSKDDWQDFIAESEYNLDNCNEQQLGAYLLNYELSEYVTKATIYKPNGDKICFS
jgi:hypothetical protein